MGLAKYTIYKHVKTAKGWRYCRPAIGNNSKLKPSIVIVEGKEEHHPEGSYFLSVAGQWVPIGATAAEAQNEQRKRLVRHEYEKVTGEKPPVTGGTPINAAAEKYFSNLEAQGKDPKTITAYRSAVDPFVSQCRKAFVEDVDKQDLIDFMGWLRKQPVPQRIHGNPERTYANKVGHVAIFLKAFGVSKLLRKSEYPQYAEKTISAHSDDELGLLYSRADDKQRFILDFALGTGFRDGEISHAEYGDLSGNIMEVKRKAHLNWHPKKHHCRKVAVPQALADAIRERANGKQELIFQNGEGKPDQHLLREVQRLAECTSFHTELHKLRKTWATRLAMAGMPVHVLQGLLGHKSLVTTQRYLADVNLTTGEMSRAVEAASYAPKVIAFNATA